MSVGPLASVAEPPAHGESGKERKRTVAEMFCGCGGLSHGFTRTGYFRVVLGNDIVRDSPVTATGDHGGRLSPEERADGL